MGWLTFKDRFIHSLPGRLRVEVYGLKGNANFAQRIENFFQACTRNVTIRACPFTGRILFTYHAEEISVEAICRQIKRLEEEYYIKQHPEYQQRIDGQVVQEAASTTALAMNATEEIPERFRTVDVAERQQKEEKPPMVLTASMVGLGILGTKQLLFGRTQLARSSGLFAMAGLLSVISGYPVLKKGFERFSRERKINEDIVLGAAALALALVRESLVVLASVSVIQFLKWQRDRQRVQEGDPALYLSSKTKTYASRNTKLGFGLAGAALLVTQSPPYALGILLAANPRPCLASEEYAWKTAELHAIEDGLVLPKQMTLCELVGAKQLIVEDTSLLYTREEEAHFSQKKIAIYLENIIQRFPDIQIQFLSDSLGILNQNDKEERAGMLISPDVFSQMKKNTGYLVVTDRYPITKQERGYIHRDELQHLADVLVYAKKAEQLTNQHRGWTAIWNVVGTSLVIPGRLAVPLANLLSDALKLLWMTRAARYIKNEDRAEEDRKQTGV